MYRGQNYCRLCNTDLEEVPLILFMRQSDFKGMKNLLGRGANPNLPSKLVDYFSLDGSYEILTTAMHLAFERRELHIALWLLKVGARIDVVDAFYKTPLDWFQYDSSQTAQAIIIFLVQNGLTSP